MLIQIDENSATLTPFGSLARHIPNNAPETKSWSELLRSVLSKTRQKRSDEIPAEPFRGRPARVGGLTSNIATKNDKPRSLNCDRIFQIVAGLHRDLVRLRLATSFMQHQFTTKKSGLAINCRTKPHRLDRDQKWSSK